MTKLVSGEYRSGLSRLLSQPTFQLALLRSQWSDVESRFKREQLRLTRKIPPDDPVRFGVNLLAPINCSLDETLHTRALSYLLDPAAPHGFKKKILASFIEKVKDASPRGSGAAALLALLRRKRTKVTVKSEYRYPVEDSKRSVARCDIWIEFHNAGAAALMIIENKIKAPEHNDQLNTYGKKSSCLDQAEFKGA
jgi:PD-(D/E)XK nuclease superfamily